SPAFNSWG
uniref:Kinin-5 n=1 Tax=Periplaneta americana TaxID=6978 RepID=KINI5_PERAM|nr:RecName: Full=Kinin-5; AltName: Full=Pea-K-5 [Periplaneta americana]